MTNENNKITSLELLTEEIRQRQIDVVTSNLEMVKEMIAGIENQGVVIEHTY